MKRETINEIVNKAQVLSGRTYLRDNAEVLTNNFIRINLAASNEIVRLVKSKLKIQ